jgi:hypothetical protein
MSKSLRSRAADVVFDQVGAGQHAQPEAQILGVFGGGAGFAIRYGVFRHVCMTHGKRRCMDICSLKISKAGHFRNVPDQFRRDLFPAVACSGAEGDSAAR